MNLFEPELAPIAATPFQDVVAATNWTDESMPDRLRVVNGNWLVAVGVVDGAEQVAALIGFQMRQRTLWTRCFHLVVWQTCRKGSTVRGRVGSTRTIPRKVFVP